MECGTNFAQIHAIECGEDGDPLKTIDELMTKVNELAAAGGSLSEVDQAAVLIKAMPKEFHPSWKFLSVT